MNFLEVNNYVLYLSNYYVYALQSILYGVLNLSFYDELYGFSVAFLWFEGFDKELLWEDLKVKNSHLLRNEQMVHNIVFEVSWTLVPAFLLVCMAIPSIVFLYASEAMLDLPALTVNVVGHQWYWTYEYGDFLYDLDNFSLISNDYGAVVIFNSYMLPDEMLESGSLSLLEVDSSLYVPVNIHIRLLITSSDVIHAWSIPSLGINVDAVPGRLNQVAIFVNSCGVYYGQCSELCGINHGFMPIVLEVIDASFTF